MAVGVAEYRRPPSSLTGPLSAVWLLVCLWVNLGTEHHSLEAQELARPRTGVRRAPLAAPAVERAEDPADPAPQLAPPTEVLVAPTPLPSQQVLRFHKEASGQDPVQLSGEGELLSLTARDASLSQVLSLIADQHGFNIVTGTGVDERLSVTLNKVRLEDALDAILGIHGYTWSRQNNIVIISKVTSDDKGSTLAVTGREVRVFALNYLSAADVEKVITGLMSPVGKVFAIQTSPTDQRKTHEQVVVEDLPRYLERIENYLLQVDVAPRQVLVEAHVLQVNLKGECRHGVDLQHLLRIANARVTLHAQDFSTGSTPAATFRIDGTDMDAFIEAVKTTTDSKTLASPKVAVVNGQQARMQVGGQIGYLLTTTTQTSTLQSVSFLEVGVILTVTPIITNDSQILMMVKPQVSTGRINATTQLPESETTEVETKILLADDEALLIGGLIRETDSDAQRKVPVLGDLWGVGRLFQRRESVRERNEIIIALRPRILSDAPGERSECYEEIERAQTPLLHGPLHPVERRQWEPKLPDARRR